MTVRMSMQTNFYRATYRESVDMTDLKTISTDDGYNIIFGRCTDGTLKVQSLLFPRSKYNIAQATISAHMLDRVYR